MALIRLNNQSISSVTALPSGIATGKVLQVRQNIISGVATTNSFSYADLVTHTITPSASTSKILICIRLGELDQLDGRVGTLIYRDGSAISSDARLAGEIGRGLGFSGTEDHLGGEFNMYLDSPNSTSELTYALRWRSDNFGNTVRVNNGSASGLTLIEIGA